MAADDWHHLKCRTTGVEQVVASLAGIDLDAWDSTEIVRAPMEHEDVVNGTIVRNREREAVAAAAARYASMTPSQIAATFEARVTALEERIATLKG